MLENISVFKRLWSHIAKQRRKQLGWLIVIMLLASFAEVVSIGTVLPFLGVLMSPERVFEHRMAMPAIEALQLTESKQLLFLVTVIFVIAAIISGGMRLILLWVQTRLSYAIGADFSSEIYKRTLYQPYSVHVSRNSSQVIAGISSKTGSVVGSTLLPLLSVVSSSLILISILFALLVIDPIVAFVAFGGFGSIYSLIMLLTKKRLARDSQLISHESNQVIKALQEGLGGIRDVLIDGTQSIYCKIYRNADLPLRKSQANIQIIAGAPRFLIEALGMVLIAMLAYELANGETGIARAVPVLGALAVGAQRLLPVLQQLYNNWTSISGGRSSLEDVLNLMEAPMPAHADKPLGPLIPFKKSIELNNIDFRYADTTPWVLQGVTFQIPKGARIGFMGTTGSGKSTLLDLIMGLLRPTHGNIAIDGLELTEDNYRGWQCRLAHVPQAIFLADTTIAENIAFGVPSKQIDYVRIRQAATQAQIASTIESWPEQYSTLVGERGVRLSGGQRQRIGIARALYKQADVIILDEATSALDGETERAVMECIDNIAGDITIVIVAHRITTLKNCDMVVELEKGSIKRISNYSDITADK